MHFGENQLSRSLIGLSPLTTVHPQTFQRLWVRSSTQSYPRFNLTMARSPRFGFRSCDYGALFRLAFATASPRRVNLATFPSRYLFTIGHQRIFRLSGWSRQIHTGFHESGITWDINYKLMKFRLQGSHLLRPTFPRRSPTSLISDLLN